MRAIDPPATFESGASLFKTPGQASFFGALSRLSLTWRAGAGQAFCLPADKMPAPLYGRLKTGIGLTLAAWFSFAPMARAADFSPVPPASTNVQSSGTPPSGGRADSSSLPAAATNSPKPTLTTEPQRAPQNTNSGLLAAPVKMSPGPANPATQTTNPPPQSNPATPAPLPHASADATNALKAGFITSMDDLDDKHHLAIGDRLSFRIMEDQQDPKLSSEPKPLVVTDSGEIEVPYVGRFPAEHKSCKQLAGEIKAALEKDYYYQATVIIAVDLMTKSRGRVYLVGPVHMPGPQELPSDEVFTLSKAIMRAGGFTDFAEKQHVKITRIGEKGEKQTLTVDVAQILEKGKTEHDVPLLPGDLVVIPERLIRF